MYPNLRARQGQLSWVVKLPFLSRKVKLTTSTLEVRVEYLSFIVEFVVITWWAKLAYLT